MKNKKLNFVSKHLKPRTHEKELGYTKITRLQLICYQTFSQSWKGKILYFTPLPFLLQFSSRIETRYVVYHSKCLIFKFSLEKATV